jgi:hypothetical protein
VPRSKSIVEVLAKTLIIINVCRYTTKAVLDHRDGTLFETQCTCPFNERQCKHAVSMLLAYVKDPDLFYLTAAEHAFSEGSLAQVMHGSPAAGAPARGGIQDATASNAAATTANAAATTLPKVRKAGRLLPAMFQDPPSLKVMFGGRGRGGGNRKRANSKRKASTSTSDMSSGGGSKRAAGSGTRRGSSNKAGGEAALAASAKPTHVRRFSVAEFTAYAVSLLEAARAPLSLPVPLAAVANSSDSNCSGLAAGTPPGNGAAAGSGRGANGVGEERAESPHIFEVIGAAFRRRPSSLGSGGGVIGDGVKPAKKPEKATAKDDLWDDLFD